MGDNMGFAPFAEVTDGMDVVDKLYGGYGEGAPQGNGPSQGRIQSEGNSYLSEAFPQLSYIETATTSTDITNLYSEETNAASLVETESGVSKATFGIAAIVVGGALGLWTARYMTRSANQNIHEVDEEGNELTSSGKA